MAKKRRRLNVIFPLVGLNRRGAYRQQPPYSSPDLNNVRPMATLEGRERGGSRPGLMKSHITDTGSNVRLLFPMIVALGDNWTIFSDTFSGSSLAAAWSQASWADNAPSILYSALAGIDTSVESGDAVLTALDIDTTEVYYVEVEVIPWGGEFHGKYRIFLRLDDTTPDITEDGVKVELISTGSSGAYTATLKSYDGGDETEVDTASGTISAAKPAWLTAIVSGTTVTVYWNGTNILSGTVDSHTGVRTGFGMDCTVEGGVSLINVFRVQYYSSSTLTGSRTLLIVSTDGDLFREEVYGALAQTTTDLTLRDDTLLTAAQSGQELFIADYGDLRVTGTDGTVSGSNLDAASVPDWTALGIDKDDDVVVLSNVGGDTTADTYKISSIASGALTLASAPGDGTCAYRIERGPKVYDPSADTLTLWTADEGQVPTGCPLICRYLDRLVLAGADIAPHVWYMSRQSDPDDWDYSQTDSQKAVAGSSSEAGVPGTAILALVPHSDDYLILGCLTSLWRLRGDPAYGGSLDALSQTVGIIGPKAWCLGPAGELVFLSLNGLYAVAPGGESFPIPLSHEILPEEFRNINPNTTTILLEYDPTERGINLFLTENSSNARTHWWFDWDRKTYWPLTHSSSHEPTAICQLQATAIEDSGVILGCRDGYLRRYSRYATTDDGTAFTAYATMGPIPLATDGMFGSIISLEGILADDSADVTWTIHPASTFESAVTADSVSTGTWSAGANRSAWQAGRGQACMLKLSSASGKAWAFEQAVMTVQEAGIRRML